MQKLFLSFTLALMMTSAAAQTPLARQEGVTVGAITIADGFDQPVYLTAPPNDPRLFVIEKTGKILVIADGALQFPPFLDITKEISTNSEQGLLGLAFHPDYAKNQRFFVYFTDPKGAITIAEGHPSTPNSVKVLLSIAHDQADNHNGGWLGFGPDGLLYIATGDGGRSGDPWGNAQNPDSKLGKILRIDVDKAAPYGIPPTNPFAYSGGAPEIFALGLRNPWRASFDGNKLYIGDVGQNAWEEIHLLDIQNPGANLGWNKLEGLTCYKSKGCDTSRMLPPLHVYDHSLGCSVTGGYVYRGTAMPKLQGRYFFSDFCAGTLMSFRLTNTKATDIFTIAQAQASLGQISSFGTDSQGELYLTTFDGTVVKLVPMID
jgi:glucose/arabinose dehydrogenase